jgi:hypothetical protein
MHIILKKEDIFENWDLNIGNNLIYLVMEEELILII